MIFACVGSLESMEAKNLAEAEGLPPLEWSRVDADIKDRLDTWDPGAADRPSCATCGGSSDTVPAGARRASPSIPYATSPASISSSVHSSWVWGG